MDTFHVFMLLQVQFFIFSIWVYNWQFKNTLKYFKYTYLTHFHIFTYSPESTLICDTPYWTSTVDWWTGTLHFSCWNGGQTCGLGLYTFHAEMVAKLVTGTPDCGGGAYTSGLGWPLMELGKNQKSPKTPWWPISGVYEVDKGHQKGAS